MIGQLLTVAMSERTTISLQVRYTRSLVVVTYAERIIASTKMALLHTSRFARKTTTTSSRAQHADRLVLQREMRPRRLCAEGTNPWDVLTCENKFSKCQGLNTYRSGTLSCTTDILLDRIARFRYRQICNLRQSSRCKSRFSDGRHFIKHPKTRQSNIVVCL